MLLDLFMFPFYRHTLHNFHILICLTNSVLSYQNVIFTRKNNTYFKGIKPSTHTILLKKTLALLKLNLGIKELLTQLRLILLS